MEEILTVGCPSRQQIEDAIVSELYFTAMEGWAGAQDNGILQDNPEALSRLTFCVLVLHNGYTVTGESACVSPENFDRELGQKIAREQAFDKCWPLFGFHLASTLYEQRTGDAG